MITKHAEEIESYLGGSSLASTPNVDESIEHPTVFALEKHLEEFYKNRLCNSQNFTTVSCKIQSGSGSSGNSRVSSNQIRATPDLLTRIALRFDII